MNLATDDSDSGLCNGAFKRVRCPQAEPAMGALKLRWANPTKAFTRNCRLTLSADDPDGKHRDTTRVIG